MRVDSHSHFEITKWSDRNTRLLGIATQNTMAMIVAKLGIRSVAYHYNHCCICARTLSEPRFQKYIKSMNRRQKPCCISRDISQISKRHRTIYLIPDGSFAIVTQVVAKYDSNHEVDDCSPSHQKGKRHNKLAIPEERASPRVNNHCVSVMSVRHLFPLNDATN